MKEQFRIQEEELLKKWAQIVTICGVIISIVLGYIGNGNWKEYSVGYKSTVGSLSQEASYIGYMSGAMEIGLILLFVSFILWTILVVIRYDNRLLKRKNINSKISAIGENENYGEEFNAKLKSLNELLKNQVLSIQEYDIKKLELTNEFEFKIDVVQNKDLISAQLEKLEDAVKIGVLTEDEYNNKVFQIKNKALNLSRDIQSNDEELKIKSDLSESFTKYKEEFQTDKGLIYVELNFEKAQPAMGNKVYQNGNKATDGKYKLNFMNYIVVNDGIINNLTSF